jgi:ABC-type phosphate transport system substrate-binding protein
MGLLLGLCATALWVPLVPSATQPAKAYAAGPAINGGGSSFAKLEIDQWRAEVARKPFELKVNYVAQGSTFGREQFLQGNLEFAASDIPFTVNELQRLANTPRKDFVYVPVSAGGLGFMYNLIDTSGNRVTDLKLTRNAVCRMFTEVDMRWNDAEIQAVNPNISLPAEFVRPIVRADGSGTSYVFSEFCINVAPAAWQAFVADRSSKDPGLDDAFKAGEPTSNWPQSWGRSSAALAADGVAAAVADSNGLYAVTYNEAGFAKVRGFPNASVQNSTGAFTQPTEEAVSVALTYADGRPDGTFKLDYSGPAPEAYFPSTYSYVIAQTTGFPADKGEVLAKFLCYAVTKGQRVDLTAALGYARLSEPLVRLAEAAIIKIPGSPPWEQCKVESAPPPPAPTTVATVATTVPLRGGTGTTQPGTATTVAGGGGGGGGGVAPTTSIVRDPVTGSTTVITSPPAAGRAPATSIVIDQKTGETIVVTIPAADASGDCLDPVTGLPVDPSFCNIVLIEDPAADDGSGAAPVNAAPPAAASPAAKNPVVSAAEEEIDVTAIAWWLLQGAAVCGVGVALAGVARRPS